MLGAATMALEAAGLRDGGVAGARGTDGVTAPGRLVVCPTPIGNLEDVTLRVLSALRDADVVACEDTRRTRVLLDRYGVDATLVSYHEHNERARAAELVARMADGAVVALVSDAGMPLVSDPGLRARAGVRRRRAGGGGAARAPARRSRRSSPARCPPIAGGSSASCRARRRRPRAVFASPETVVAFEAPGRVAASLRALAGVDPARQVAVCRELTKLHEEVVRGTAADLAARYAAAAPRGEVVLVVAGAPGARARRRPGGRRRRAGPPRGRGREAAAGGRRRRAAHRACGERRVPRVDRLRARVVRARSSRSGAAAGRSRPARPRRSGGRSGRGRAGRS